MVISVKAARVNRNMTQADVAKRLGISKGQYQRLENDLGSMKLDRAAQLGEVLGMSIDDIFFGSNSSVTCIAPAAVAQVAGGDQDA